MQSDVRELSYLKVRILTQKPGYVVIEFRLMLEQKLRASLVQLNKSILSDVNKDWLLLQFNKQSERQR